MFHSEENDFKNKVEQKAGFYLVSKGLAIHAAVLVIVFVSGIYHAKTERKGDNDYVLPTDYAWRNQTHTSLFLYTLKGLNFKLR